MDSQRLSIYLRSIEPESPALFGTMEQYAKEHYVPIVRPETAAFLRTMIASRQPKEVLEVGTAIGYSALQMTRNLPPDGHITTIEKFEKRIPLAREFFRQAGEEERITLLEGDAAEILKTLDGPYDFIFMDAAKGQYPVLLPEVMRLLAPGGVLITDNILQDGTILESRYAVTRRDRTIHSRVREYLWELKHREDLETSILPVGDGVSLSIKIGKQNNEET